MNLRIRLTNHNQVKEQRLKEGGKYERKEKTLHSAWYISKLVSQKKESEEREWKRSSRDRSDHVPPIAQRNKIDEELGRY